MPRRQNPVADIFNDQNFKQSEYPFPNDDEATRAYSCLNTVWTLLLRDSGNDLISAPVTEGKGEGRNLKVLDVGARGSSWMSGIEDRYPDVRITVIDPGCAWLYPTDVTVYHDLEGGGGSEDSGDVERKSKSAGEWPFTARQAFHHTRAFALWGMISD
ncbi:hypothetical protein BDW72DRAFT_197662 [Aspergillus terricola var. indicus]